MNRRNFLGAGIAAAIGTAGVCAADPPKAMWTLDLRSPCYGGPSFADLDGTPALVFGTYFNDEQLYAVRAKDGHVLWKFKSEGGPFDASVAITDLDGDGQNEILAADSSTGTLFCLDGAGKVKWKHKLPNSTDSPPSVADLNGDGKPEVVVGVMMTGDRHGRVLALDPRTRKQLWVAKIPGHVQSEPVLGDLTGTGRLNVIVTTWRGDKCIHALNGGDGTPLWKHAMKGDMYHGVSVLPGKEVRILVASIAGDVTLLDGAGKVVWTKQPGGYLFAPTTVTPTSLIVCGSRVHALDFAGNEMWRSGEFGSIARGAAVIELGGQPQILFGAKDRHFHALDAGSGKELWRFDATAQGHVYEGIDTGPVIADFDGDGQLEAFFVTGKGTSDQTRPQNYGKAYAIKLGSGKGAWPMFRGNLRRTGAV